MPQKSSGARSARCDIHLRQHSVCRNRITISPFDLGINVPASMRDRRVTPPGYRIDGRIFLATLVDARPPFHHNKAVMLMKSLDSRELPATAQAR